ncbi:hypothetical protein AN958_12627 [Leucoagaricus sp. SymC.cos]|nr:hypothetical protein AN958_12627 [Leucoagaricus sp. SymC.cos]
MSTAKEPLATIVPSVQGDDAPEAQDQSPPTPDDKYYLKEDPMAIFLVDRRLYRVHRHYFLEESEIFRDIFRLQPGSNTDCEGTSDERPILLPEAKRVEFEALMDYFYSPPHVQVKSRRGLDFYLNLLSISHRFVFEEVFQYALKEIRPNLAQIPIDRRLSLGAKYDLEEWQSSVLNELVSRPTILSKEEAEALGLERVLVYIRLREDVQNKRLQDKEKEMEMKWQKLSPFRGRGSPFFSGRTGS